MLIILLQVTSTDRNFPVYKLILKIRFDKDYAYRKKYVRLYCTWLVQRFNNFLEIKKRNKKNEMMIKITHIIKKIGNNVIFENIIHVTNFWEICQKLKPHVSKLGKGWTI